MHIPKFDFCPADFIKRLEFVSTADSFKHWNTCMDNRTCKIVAIVGIVLAVIFLFWIISTLIRCLCMGVSCLEALCCSCCYRTRAYNENYNTAYNNPNMYRPNQPVYGPGRIV